MHSQVALPEVARSRLDFPHLTGVSGRQTDPGADGSAIAARAHQAQQHSVVAGCGVVAQQLHRSTVVRHEDVEIAVVVDVADCQRPADRFHREAGTRRAADFLEPAVAVVSEQQLSLRFLGAGPEVP